MEIGSASLGSEMFKFWIILEDKLFKLFNFVFFIIFLLAISVPSTIIIFQLER